MYFGIKCVMLQYIIQHTTKYMMELQNNLSAKTINIMILGGKHQLAKKTPCFCALLAHSTPKLLLIS
jgi:hypothetical protein